MANWWEDEGYGYSEPDYYGAGDSYDLGDLSEYMDDFSEYDFSQWDDEYAEAPYYLQAPESSPYFLQQPGETPDYAQMDFSQGAEPQAQVDLSEASPNAMFEQRMGEREEPGRAAESPLTKAMARMGGKVTESPGRTAQALTGLGGVAMMAAGLAGKKPKVSTRGRPMTPQEQAAAAALAEQRARVSRSPSDRGYAGEEQLRQKFNDQLLAALEGNDELASPATVRALNEQRTSLVEQLRSDLGPGAFGPSGQPLATAAQNALKNFDIKAEAILAAERDRVKRFLQQSGMDRSRFANQLEMQPGGFAREELGAISSLGSEDARLRYAAASGNAQQAGADRRALLTTGGQFAGMALSPYMYAMLRSALARGE